MAKKKTEEKKVATDREILESLFHKISYIESVVKAQGEKLQVETIKSQLFSKWLEQQKEEASKEEDK